MKRIAVIEFKQRDWIKQQLAKSNDISLCCFAEWKPAKTEDGGVPVISIDDLAEDNYDVLLVAVKENRWLSKLLTYLYERGIRKNVYALRLFTMDARLDFLAGSESDGDLFDMQRVDGIPAEGKPHIVHLETHVCDNCNLNCKQCNNFSPFVREPVLASLAQFEHDMQKLSGLFSHIGRFFLLGGEPLLAPELCCDMMKVYRKYFLDGELRILTNALLVTKMTDSFWQCVRENNAIIHISLYPPVKPYISQIEQCLNEHGVTWIIHREVDVFTKHWTRYPFEDEKVNVERCGSGGCHYLRTGMLAKCPDSLLIGKMAESLGCWESDLNSRNGIVLDECTDARMVIKMLDAPIDMCKKCTFTRSERKTWAQIEGKADPEDWFLPNRFEAENAKLSAQVEALKIGRGALQGQLAERDGLIDSMRHEHEVTCGILKSMENSLSFRVGRGITWLPRKVRDVFL